MKFALAEIVRSAALKHRGEGDSGDTAVGDIFARLAEDRFNLVVAGRFNRGKTSLMNALLSTTRLPVDILPLTSVITTVSYGSEEIATIEYQERSIPERVSLDRLDEYVTERGNPGNVLGIATARIQLPADLLRRGFHFIDTPGVGSPVVENTATTHAFLPEADAVLLVTSFESPLSEDEMRIVQLVRSYGRRLFFIVNKADLVDPGERAKIRDYVLDVLRSIGIDGPEVFSVCAREGQHFGIDGLYAHLMRFLVERKQADFLRVMCDRIADVVDDLPDCDSERANLRALAQAIRGGPIEAKRLPTLDSARETRFFGCAVCERESAAVVAFLSSYQYALVKSERERSELAEGGFCGVHAWQYHAFAGPRGACVALSVSLIRAAERLERAADALAVGGSIDAISQIADEGGRCPVCRVRSDAELAAVGEAARAIREDTEDGSRSYCLGHFRAVAKTLRDTELVRRATKRQAEAMTTTADDMRRYVLKFDATRRYLMDWEERDADRRGVELVAGSRGANGIPRER
ncbi:MAG: dynamin family protein [bacterium]|nr:dynamin family protein [bacterium]